MPPADPLEGLRALHLPPETGSFWSDLGFSAALGLAVALAAVFALRAFYRPKQSLRRSASEALKQAEALPPDERRVAQAAILRRVVRTVEGDEAARAMGPAWAAALDRAFKTDFFTARAGSVFADGLYAPSTAQADDAQIDRELDRLVSGLGR